nr:ABC transporter substrate-binding protein [uncultured Oscillibacter sp.]
MRAAGHLPLLGLSALICLLALCGCTQSAEQTPPPEPSALAYDALEYDHSAELLYAEQFSIDFYTGGYIKIAIGDGNHYLAVPEGAEVPAGIPADVTVIRRPLESIYLVATSAMDLFRGLDAIDAVTLAGLDAEGWYIPEAREAMEAGRMSFAGKYGAPDYERILELNCDLAIESTMIYHTPEVKEQLERLGVPVLVERSSYESHPLGRIEWIKLYGALLGKEAEAEAYFAGLMERLTPILEQENTGKTVAFFYITSAGAVNVRRSGDYIARAIGLAGGVYAFPDLTGDGAKATMNMQMESFYEGARNADVLVYNSAIDGELAAVDQLLEKSAVLADFKAVREGNVWCTGQNLFQESLGLGDLIADLHTVLTGGSAPLTYLHHLD